jgi:hypothetical protein
MSKKRKHNKKVAPKTDSQHKPIVGTIDYPTGSNGLNLLLALTNRLSEIRSE